MAFACPISINLSQASLTPQGTPERVVTQKLTRYDGLGHFEQKVYDHIKDSKFYQKYESKLKVVRKFCLLETSSEFSDLDRQFVAYDKMCKTVLVAFLAYAKTLSNIEFNKYKDERLDSMKLGILASVSNRDALNEPYYKFILSKLEKNHIVKFCIFDEHDVPDLVVSAINDVSDINFNIF